MKRIVLISLILFSLFSCKNKELEQEIASLKEINKELTNSNFEQDSAITNFMESFNEISQNLAEIRQKETSIELSSENKSGDVKALINEDLQIINDLMAQNRAKIEELDKQLKGSYYTNSKLKKAMEKLKEDFMAQIEAKDGEITVLKADLEKMNFTIEELNSNITSLSEVSSQKDEIISEKEGIITEQTEKLHTAFYALGNTKELVEKEIVAKEGGFIGIGKSLNLNSNINEAQFNKIDITETLDIPLEGKKAELITSHPEGSYKIEGSDKKVSKLVILDPEKFWNSSKYLVVMVD
ncbi:hypothetical protein [Flexithrix dorotheae]|uniref:Cbp1 family collagen-binding glycoprotein adhesin n=1 Tax=Flexithrix dorotheae TaxID=70993 RepID=UPI00035D2839|nr:hypothetical protein [Flexithrix dorotheae]